MPEPIDLDLPTLAVLAGNAASDWVLLKVRAAGFDGVRVSHGYVMQHLVTGDRTIGDLAELQGVTQQAASKTVREMELLGLVELRTDPDDRRVRRVTLTDHGRHLLVVTRRIRQRLEKSVARKAVDLDAGKAVLVAILDATGAGSAVRARGVRPLTPEQM